MDGQIREFIIMWDAGCNQGNYVICELANSWKIFLWMLFENFVM
jgi:hypothetical protein